MVNMANCANVDMGFFSFEFASSSPDGKGVAVASCSKRGGRGGGGGEGGEEGGGKDGF